MAAPPGMRGPVGVPKPRPVKPSSLPKPSKPPPGPKGPTTRQAPIDKFFNAVGKGTVAAKQPRAPKAPAQRQPRQGPYTPPKQQPTPTPKQKPQPTPAGMYRDPQGRLHFKAGLGAQQQLRSQARAAQHPVPHIRQQLQAEGLNPKDALKEARRIQAAVGSPMEQWARDILNIPGGVYQSFAAPVGDITSGNLTFPATRKLAWGMYHGLGYTIHHPGADPFMTGMTALGAVAPAFKLGEIGMEAGAAAAREGVGAGLRTAARSAINKGPTALASRTLRHGDFETQGIYSKSAMGRTVQRVHDRLVQKWANSDNPGGMASRYLAGRVGRDERKNRLVREAIERAPAAVLSRHHLTTPQQAALRSYAENTPALLRAAFHEQAKNLGEGSAIRHFAHQKINELSAKYLRTDEHGNVQFADTRQGQRLASIYKEMEDAAHSREDMMRALGYTPSEARVHLPGQIIRATTGEPGMYAETGRMRVPYPWRRASRAQGQPAGMGTAGVVQAAGRVPSTFKQAFKGVNLLTGRFRTATTRLVAESQLEAQRYYALTAALDRLKGAVHAEPQPGDIMVKLTPKLSEGTKALLDKAAEGVQLSKDEARSLGDGFEAFHKDVFPKLSELGDVKPGEIGYINRKLLGGLNVRPKLGGRWPIWDTLNSAAKLGLVYGKPSYIPANLLGNLALSVSQQGALVLRNLPKAIRMEARLGASNAAKVDNLMGAGVSRSIIGDETRTLEHAAGKVADIMSVPTDRYTRRGSWNQEAERAGFHTPKQQDRLLNDPALRDKLIAITRQAREHQVEFEDMTPNEKAVLRRLIFIYPWVKGSTMYAARFPREHPMQAAFLTQSGHQAALRADRELGPRPSYMEGIFRVGGTNAMPSVLNPAAASTFGTSAQWGDMARGLVTGKMHKQDWPFQQFTPVAQMLGGMAFGVNPGTGGTLSSPWGAIPGFVQGFPQERLYEALTGKPSPNAIYQRSKTQALGQYMLGGSTFPSTLSRANLGAVAHKEAVGLMSPQRKAAARVLDARTNMFNQFRDHGVPAFDRSGKRLVAPLRKAWNLEQQRASAVSHIHRPPPGATKGQRLKFQQDSAQAELDLALKLKLVGPRWYKFAKKAIASAQHVNQVSQARSFLKDTVFGYRAITQARSEATKQYGVNWSD